MSLSTGARVEPPRAAAPLSPGDSCVRAFAVLAAAAAVVVVGKLHYSTATADELRWILAPTAAVVSSLGDSAFTFESGAGWVNRELMYIIAPSCAGVNFAVAGFFVLIATWALVGVRRGRWAALFALAAAIAYGATIAINSVRLLVAIALHRGAVDLGGLDAGELHRAVGMVTYLGGLVALAWAARRWRPGAQQRDRLGPRAAWWLAAPVSVYAGVTVVVPWINGAGGDQFAVHARWVATACGLAVLTASCAGAIPRSRPVEPATSNEERIRS